MQINIDPQKLSGTDLQIRIPSSNNDIFFGERMFYNDYVKAGLCLDITDIVTEQNLPGEEKTIADKMTESQQKFFTVDGKIYGVPHYSGGMGIAYNVDFFDDNALYFKKDWKDTPEDPFTSRTASDVSEGPDGKPSTYNDGLPVTYEEFYVLCDYIADNISSAKPLLWNGRRL